MTNFILASAGHVDHGKSALVKALTGTDPDRLPEEKARGITIDLGFAELNLTGSGDEKLHVGIVDVPGHEDFVRNMIAGVGSIDVALLVVAADDGWMPQTEEHFQILSYLGVKRIVVALTKSDLGNIDNVTSQIREQLSNTPFGNASIVPTSVRTGDGIENLKDALASGFAASPPPRDIGKPRMFVDRAFRLRGIGTVVTGTLIGGRIRRGQSVVIQPRSLPARVRSIQNHGRDLEIAQPGMRTAINLPDLSVGPDGIQRGDVITVVDLGNATGTVDVLLEKSARLNRTALAARPLKNGSSVFVHFGTTRVSAKITLLEQDVVERGQRAIARLRLDSPIFAFVSDRFVLRDSSEQNTIAGGAVLDVDGNRENFRNTPHARFLKSRAAAPDNVDVCIQSQLARDGFVRTATLLIKSNFTSDQIVETLSRLEARGAIVLRDEIAADAGHWRNLVSRVTTLIDREHEQHPERYGLDLMQLRSKLNIGSDELCAVIISELIAGGFVRHNNNIARAAHRPSLPPEILPAAETIRAALSVKRFDPPGRKEFLQDRHLHQALRFLIEQGEIIEVSSEIILLREAAEEMRDAVVEFLAKHRSATASQLRQKIGTSRRVIIPFLEYLDRSGVTERVSDQRVLAKKAAIAKLDDGAISGRS